MMVSAGGEVREGGGKIEKDRRKEKKRKGPKILRKSCPHCFL